MMSNTTHGAASQTASQPADDFEKKASRIFWQILAAGFFTPILVGIAVNFYLQLSGRPHLEWSELWPVGNLIGLLVPVILSWFPFVLLAWVARSRVLLRGLVEKPVYGAFAGGEVGAIVYFWWGWQEIQGLIHGTMFLLPVWTPIVVGMLVGSGIGWLTNILRPARGAARGHCTNVKKNKIMGLEFFFLWFVMGGVVATCTTSLFIMASIGGVFDPPAIWSFARDLGLYALPFLLIVGGAPAAIQMMRGRPWRKAALVAFSICAATWTALMFVVIWGPPILGWSW